MLDKKVPVKLSLSINATFTDNVRGFNVVAEIPGSDPALASQVVMLGGHLDSWHTATGATDNGAGCAVAMEAVRLIQTLRVEAAPNGERGLWSGEEQDYFGSLGYVTKHFGNPNGSERTPEFGAARGVLQSRQRQREDTGDQPAGQRGRAADLRGLAAARSRISAQRR